ncbi:MAG: lipid-binding SYLF domain-containing protein [Acidobacteriia bacterium]|nr:lipid-binding SYLF domain-containing protein [Terriglobia bacterium]
MLKVFKWRFVLALVVGWMGAVTVQAQNTSNAEIQDQVSQSQKAARVFREIMNTPDKSIPSGVLDRAECVAVFPSVVKAGFIFGGGGGRGVASCRAKKGWTMPAFFNLARGSFGLQIGAQSTDFILLFMNENGLNSLLSDKFEMGGDASVAAGPVGRQTGASTDLKIDAQILSYSRSRGVFAGLELKGAIISQDKDHIHLAYGNTVDAKQVLQDQNVKGDPALRAFPDTLAKYSSRPAQR